MTPDRIEAAARECWDATDAVSFSGDDRACVEAIAALVRRERGEAADARQSEIESLIQRISELNADDASLNGEHRRRLLAEIVVNLDAIRVRGGKAQA